MTIYEGAVSSCTVGGFQVSVTPLGINQFGGTNFSGDNPWVQPEHDIVARFDVCPAGDLDGDCDVDLFDFVIMANNWLVGTEN